MDEGCAKVERAMGGWRRQVTGSGGGRAGGGVGEARVRRLGGVVEWSGGRDGGVVTLGGSSWTMRTVRSTSVEPSEPRSPTRTGMWNGSFVGWPGVGLVLCPRVSRKVREASS